VNTPLPEKPESGDENPSATAAQSISCDGAPDAKQVPAESGATVAQKTTSDDQSLPSEATQSAMLQQPACVNPSPAKVSPQGLKQIILDPGSIPAEGALPIDPAFLEFTKSVGRTGAAPSNSAKTALTDPSQATVVPEALQATIVGPKASLAKGIQTIDPALSGPPQTQETSSATSSSFTKYALAERLSIPKAEIQILKLNPEIAKPSQPEPSKPADVRPQAAPSEPNQALSQGQVGDKDSQPPSMKPREETAQVGLIRPEDSAQTQKAHTAPAEALAFPIGDGIKTASGSPHTETTVVRPNPVFTQVEGSIRWILQNKAQGAELQLHPESLGRVIIQLRVEGQEVHARLWASEASSLPVLREHKAFLEASLKEQGLSLGSFDLHSGARNDQAQTAFQERAMANLSGSLPSSEVKQKIPTNGSNAGSLDSTDPHQIEVYA
jgi:flagellar hook-length control protein FliK